MKKKGNKLGGILFLGFFAVLCLTVGGGGVYVGVNNILLQKYSLSWPHTNGKIIFSSIKFSSPTSSSTSRPGFRKATVPGSVVAHADIKYEYVVDDSTYHHYRVSYGDYGAEESLAQRIVDRYPIGKVVAVYYKPDNPQEALLEPEGTKGGIIILLAVGAVFLIIGGSIGFYLYLQLNPRIAMGRDQISR